MRGPDRGDGALHAWSAAGVTLLVALVGGGGYYANASSQGGPPPRPPLAELEAMEVALAMKSEAPPKKLPDKPKQAPPPEVKVEGASRDPDRPVEPEKDKKKEETKPPPKDLDEQMRKLREQRLRDDEDAEFGKPPPDQGTFDGSKYGWATESKGDPYLQKLVGDLLSCWTYPRGLAEEGEPVGCMRLDPDGRITDTLFRTKSGNPDLDQSVERALKQLKELRNENPVAVPSQTLPATRKWICFKFIVRE